MSGIIPLPFNAYSSWLDVAQTAKFNLVIFSPFFDEMIIHLFEESGLEWKKMGLVTQLDWEDRSLQSFKKQALIEKLISLGVDVRILDRLHAKAIVADWDLAVVGSQNFTYYSQDSYEISLKLDRYAENANVDEIFWALEEWWESADDDNDDDDDDE